MRPTRPASPAAVRMEKVTMAHSESMAQADLHYVRIFDTTLRDGEQSPGCTMNVEEKIAIARQLERLNVDIIEAGFAPSPPPAFEPGRRIAAAPTNPTVLSLPPTPHKDTHAPPPPAHKPQHP